MKAKRPKLDKLYELVSTHKIDVVVIEHKDRLARFMFDVFKAFFASHIVEIIFVEQDLPKTFENELVSDIMSLMTSFTATLHSRRKRQSKEYRKRMEQDGIVA
jgi:predicted site-specific integrase-resolvase